jgi:PIN domain nuclease of toxin-antitoxin system
VTAWLVDTHALLWFLSDDAQLSPDAKRTMESGENVLLASSACVWEMAIKSQLGKLTIPPDLPSILIHQGFAPLEVTAEHAWAVADLPLGDHRDPFDRLLVAQARIEGLGIISNDAQLDQYHIRRHW